MYVCNHTNLEFLSHSISSESITFCGFLHHNRMGTTIQMVLKRTTIPHILVTNMTLQQFPVEVIIAGLPLLLFFCGLLRFLLIFTGLRWLWFFIAVKKFNVMKYEILEQDVAPRNTTICKRIVYLLVQLQIWIVSLLTEYC